MNIEKVKKLIVNLHDKEQFVIYWRNLKQVLNHELVLKKVHTVIKFNKKSWLKPNIDMSKELRKKPRNDFEKDFI